MRLGDLDALKKEFDIIASKSATGSLQTIPIKDIKQIIDNVPTEGRTFIDGYNVGFEMGKKERPQGEWINICTLPIIRKCSICGNEIGNEMGFYNNFCPNCGTDMRGSKNE